MSTRAAAQEVLPGQVAERVVSASDSTQAYAVYLPSTYTDSSEWPILFLLDPRGRALVPLARFRAAAERNGWILMSSWNTLSDGPAEPNVLAVNAMLGDALATFRVNRERLYLGGFSGTARLAWDFASQLRGVAGIFGASASTGPRHQLFERAPARVAFYGTAGELDFNHDEVQRFRRRLASWELPHRVRIFEGRHEWPGDSLAAEAIDWFDLQAMKHRQMALDEVRVARLYEADTRATAALEANDEWLGAYERYQEITADYAGLRDVSDAEERVRRLSRDARVRRSAEKRERLLEENGRRDSRLFEFMDRVRRTALPPRIREALVELDVERLKRTAAGGDKLVARAAGRALEQIFVSVSFYLPRELIARGRAAHALAVLEIADAIKPAHPQVLVERARARARTGPEADARAAIDAALRAGVDSAVLATDTALALLLRR